jgi:hypothetical protein
VRAALHLLGVIGACGIAVLLASCTTTSQPTASGGSDTSGQPTPTSVEHGRFVTPVDLDDGGLRIEPPGAATARITMKTAAAMFGATDAVQGDYRFAILGLGVTSISPRRSTTTTAGQTTTTGQATTSSTSPLPTYNGRLAWVGIAWGLDCPARTSDAPTRDVAVIFDAQSGRDVIAYTSRGVASCGGPQLPPTLSRPQELVSIPWTAVGPTSTAVNVTIPACGSYYGWTEQPGPGTAALEVVARWPYDSRCPSGVAQTQTVDDVVPLGDAQNQVPHAPLGPVAGLRSLPAD